MKQILKVVVPHPRSMPGWAFRKHVRLRHQNLRDVTYDVHERDHASIPNVHDHYHSNEEA